MGGDCRKEIAGGAVIVVFELAGFEGVLAGEDAVIVTRLPAGTDAGAV